LATLNVTTIPPWLQCVVPIVMRIVVITGRQRLLIQHCVDIVNFLMTTSVRRSQFTQQQEVIDTYRSLALSLGINQVDRIEDAIVW
jgi:hypothetical protein